MRQDVGANAIAVQIHGDHNTTTIICGGARLHLDHKHRLNTRPATTDLELLHTEARHIDLVGRGEDLHTLQAWLGTPADVSVRCITGQAGSGKTRLAIEVCERAENSGWRSGFARHADLKQNLSAWYPDQDAVVVVGYAAAAAPELKEWLESLAIRPPGGPRL